MWTLLIIGCLVTVVFIVVAVYKHKIEWITNAVACLSATVVLFLSSYNFSYILIPKEYQEIENYFYTTETGAIEKLEGRYFKKGDTYYTLKIGKANWIPFTSFECVEVDLPGNVAISENADPGESKKFCTTCGKGLNAEDKFCAGCGVKI